MAQSPVLNNSSLLEIEYTRLPKKNRDIKMSLQTDSLYCNREFSGMKNNNPSQKRLTVLLEHTGALLHFLNLSISAVNRKL
jgi:hypothetical protein